MPEPCEENGLIILKGGLVVNHDTCCKADVLIENGIIKDLGPQLTVPEGAKVLDVTDQFLLPGGVDLDCHLAEPCLEDPVADTFESGSQAAILGGTTTVVNTVYVPDGKTLLESLECFVKQANGNMWCDYAACMRVPCFNEEISADLERLVKEKGVCLFSLLLGSSHDSPKACSYGALCETDFNKALRLCRRLGALPIVPAMGAPQLMDQVSEELVKEYPTIGPEIHQLVQTERAEADTIRKAVLHAFESDSVCPLLISRIQSNLALECFCEQRRKCRGLLFGQTVVSAIAAPMSALHNRPDGHLPDEMDFTTAKDWGIAAGYVCEPPLRPDIHVSDKLVIHLTSSDTLTVGSGHRAVRVDVKAALGLKQSTKIPRGVAALGCRLIALWACAVENNSGVDPCTFVRAVSTDPARLANLYPQKGRIAIGSDADIVVWSKPDLMNNTNFWEQLLPEGAYNVFSGLPLHSRPETVLLRGHIVVQSGMLVKGDRTYGKLLSLKPFGQMAFSRTGPIDQFLSAQMEKISREPYTGPVAGKGEDVTIEKPEHHFFRKEHYDNVPKVALPPGQRQIHTSVRTAQPPGGSSNVFW